jgi:hypothetical protein
MTLARDRDVVVSRLWQQIEGTGLERFELCREAGGWALCGTILALEDGEAIEAAYQIVCDAAWRTERADISVRSDAGVRAVHLTTADGRWFENGAEKEAVRGCVDIDLSWTPSTNTLPIRRLNLALGARSGPVTAAWIRFPALAIEPLPQEYHHIAERRYQFTSHGGAFTAALDVDEEGVILNYEGAWRQVR